MTDDSLETTLPDALFDHDNWIAWGYTIRDGDQTKVPFDPTTYSGPQYRLGMARPNDPTTWAQFHQARAAADHPDAEGVGFMFGDDDQFVGIDLDDVRDPDTHAVHGEAGTILGWCETYTEYSPSNTGYHAIGLGSLPDHPNRKSRGDLTPDDDFPDAHLEAYDSGRFFTMTGHHLPSAPTGTRPLGDAIPDLLRAYLWDHDTTTTTDETDPNPIDPDDYDPDHDASVDVSLSDRDLRSLAQQAKNGEYFSDLWRGRWERHTHRWPGGSSHSEADLALCSQLAFWTQKDPGQMDRMFRRSGLMRPKWDEDRGTQTYGERTIAEALRGTHEVYDPAPNPEDDEDGDEDEDGSEQENTDP